MRNDNMSHEASYLPSLFRHKMETSTQIQTETEDRLRDDKVETETETKRKLLVASLIVFPTWFFHSSRSDESVTRSTG